jgi:hypothetical protein
LNELRENDENVNTSLHHQIPISIRRGGSCRIARDTNNKISDLIRFRNNNIIQEDETMDSRFMTPKPVPPNRTSSLLHNKSINPNINLISTTPSKFSNRNSVYSNMSLRFTNSGQHQDCISLNMLNCESKQDSIVPLSPLPHHSTNSLDTSKIESCYQSIGSNVYACKCSADVYLTDFDGIVRLLDWTHEINGIPVWIFNTGINPKRGKNLSIVMADKATGFALWQINSLNYLNDFKWTKPGHITFKIFSNNIDSGN